MHFYFCFFTINQAEETHIIISIGIRQKEREKNGTARFSSWNDWERMKRNALNFKVWMGNHCVPTKNYHPAKEFFLTDALSGHRTASAITCSCKNKGYANEDTQRKMKNLARIMWQNFPSKRGSNTQFLILISKRPNFGVCVSVRTEIRIENVQNKWTLFVYAFSSSLHPLSFASQVNWRLKEEKKRRIRAGSVPRW